MLNVQNARQQSGRCYAGKIVLQDWPILRLEINREYQKLTGHRLEHSVVKFTDFELQHQYECVRKGYHKVRSKGHAVVNELPLFGETEGSCLIYAYTGLVAKYPNVRLIKIGYTRQNLRDYLAGKRIQHEPKLLAYTSGDEQDEKRYKSKWKRAERVADGNEWLWPESDVVDWIVDTYDSLETDFRKRAAEAEQSLREYKAIINRY